MSGQMPAVPPGATVVSGNARPLRSVAMGVAVLAGAIAVIALVAGSPGGALVAFLVAAAAAALSRETILAYLRWHRPDLVVPEEGLPLGAGFDLHYRRRARKIRDVSGSTLRCTLVCEERATYRRGTTTTTDTARVVKQTFEAEAIGTAWGFEGYLPVDIPFDAGAPTFDLGNNEVRWILTVQADGPSMPADQQSFPLLVIPVLAATEPPSRVQDS